MPLLHDANNDLYYKQDAWHDICIYKDTDSLVHIAAKKYTVHWMLRWYRVLIYKLKLPK